MSGPTSLFTIHQSGGFSYRMDSRNTLMSYSRRDMQKVSTTVMAVLPVIRRSIMEPAEC